MLIPENKYFHLERLFCELAKEIGIKDWSKVEAHATDIWARKGHFSSLSEKTSRNYFEELFQLLGKLDIQIIIALEKKNAREKDKKLQRKEKSKCQYALLHAIEHRLSRLNETSIMISDRSDTTLDDLLFERTKWRYNPGARKSRKKPTKFKFETQSCFLLDRIHHVDSEKSLFIQIVDHVAFVNQRAYTYGFLRDYPVKGIDAERGKIPVSSGTYNYIYRNILVAYFNDEAKDITFIDPTFPPNDFVIIGDLNKKPV